MPPLSVRRQRELGAVFLDHMYEFSKWAWRLAYRLAEFLKARSQSLAFHSVHFSVPRGYWAHTLQDCANVTIWYRIDGSSYYRCLMSYTSPVELSVRGISEEDIYSE